MASEGRFVGLESQTPVGWRNLTARSIVSISIAVGITLSWLFLHLPALQWLGQALQESARFNVMLLLLSGALLGFFGLRYGRSLPLTVEPVLHPLPVSLMVGTGVSAIAFRWWLALDHIPVLLFLLGSYGLLGLFLHPTIWRRGLALAIAIACLVPFGVQFNTGLGFPIRILTAHTVEQLLAHFHIAAISSENIIVLENGIASVDLPCSGVKSLWTGTLFLLLATWLEKRQLGLRWLLIFLMNAGMLVLANIGRVLLLVVIADVLNQPEMARLLHVPLGLIGFISACLLTLVLLRWLPRQDNFELSDRQATIQLSSKEPKQKRVLSLKTRVTQGLLIACLIGMSLIPRPAVSGMTPLALTDLSFPSHLQVQPLPLTATEEQFFANFPGTVAQKFRFESAGVSGSWLMVSAATWRSHHAPELCLLGNGYRIDHVAAQPLTSSFSGRWLSLNRGQNSAAYWFQASRQTTGDFLERIWGEVSRQEPRWVMVSVLFDQPYTAQEPQVQELLTTLHTALDHRLQGVKP